jgi:hypothetical protein
MTKKSRIAWRSGVVAILSIGFLVLAASAPG